ncbi:MAG TPA: 2-octaprenyl-6-methoxyphenyl hydroxylase [Woeseiaceae bacterium]|nr:2-octaprenyl-6-methoxyphenyl hydroxylase [Woeseiaceae bacterium]
MGATDMSYDIVIAGGGMIGASLALALSPLGLRVAVVEAVARGEARQPSFDDRSTALSRSTQRMFEAMGLWDEVISAATPIRRIHVSDRGRFGFSHIDAAEQGVEALGYVVINRVLGDVLQSALTKAATVEVMCPARVVDIDTGRDFASAKIETADGSNQALGCQLLVAADGANSAVRPMMGICAKKTDYGQHAVIGNLLPEKSLDNCAYERFTGQGPLALLPVADDRAAFVWTVSSHDAGRVLGLDDEAFLDELQQAFGYRLGRLSRVGKRAGYPLSLSKALRLTAERSVLVGNSAHGLHPVAAQGFNLGMRDVAALCDCIADARGAEPSADLGDPDLLARYAQWRRDDQGRLVRLTDGIVRLFGSSSPPLRAARNIGMLGFDLIPGVRSLFAKHMMGLAGRLPRLSRGVPLK